MSNKDAQESLGRSKSSFSIAAMLSVNDRRTLPSSDVRGFTNNFQKFSVIII